jgi:hypothetical protein
MNSHNQLSHCLIYPHYALICVISDGAMLAIGAEDFCYPVAVYKNVDGVWETHGNPINDPSSHCQNGRNLLCRGFYHGYYVALSGNGERLVIGSIIRDVWDDAEVAVTSYQWNTTIADWGIMEEKEAILRPFFLHDTPRADWPQKCIVLSDDAVVLAVGSKLAVDVYSWNQTLSAWTLRSIDSNENESKSLVG